MKKHIRVDGQSKNKLKIIVEMCKDLFYNGRVNKNRYLIKYDISERTFQRYIKELKELGVDIDKTYDNVYVIAD